MLLVMNRTLPSTKETLTPAGCLLRVETAGADEGVLTRVTESVADSEHGGGTRGGGVGMLQIMQ